LIHQLKGVKAQSYEKLSLLIISYYPMEINRENASDLAKQ